MSLHQVSSPIHPTPSTLNSQLKLHFSKVLKPGFHRWVEAYDLPVAVLNYFTEMCSGSEAGSYLRLLDFVYYSILGLRVIKKQKKIQPRT